MKNLNLVLLVFGFALAGQSFAAEERKDQAVNAWDTDLYFGYAFPMKLNYQGFLPALIDINSQREADSGNAALVGIAINYNCCSWHTLGVSSELYTPFNYTLFGAAKGLISDKAADNFVIQFNLNHQAFLFNIYLHLPENVAWQVRNVNLTPLIGGGLGIGLNKITGFQFVGYNTTIAALA